MYRNGQISIDCSILNTIMNNMRLEKFFMFVLFAEYRQIADFNYCSPCLTARYKKMLQSYSDYFLVV